MTKNVEENDWPSLWDWVKALCTVVVVGILSYKVYLTPIELTVDFPTLLSLLLALFSVGLAALFYFKATETSNTFYDNTYNFTKDIAQLLVKIESGFGERLRNLDEGYASMRDYLQSGTSRDTKVDETKQKIRGEKEEIEKVVEERNKIISDLIERSQLEQGEKDRILASLAEKERELEVAQKQLSRMTNQLLMEKAKRRLGERLGSAGIESFTLTEVVRRIGVEQILRLSAIGIKKKADEILGRLPRQYIADLEGMGYFENGLTREGVHFLRDIARKEVESLDSDSH